MIDFLLSLLYRKIGDEDQQDQQPIIINPDLQFNDIQVQLNNQYIKENPQIILNYLHQLEKEGNILLCNKYKTGVGKWLNNYQYDLQTFLMATNIHGLPIKEIQHDPNLKNYDNQTLQDILIKQCLPVPNEYYDWRHQHLEKNNEQFQQAIYGKIPDIQNIKPDQQNCDGFTLAMILAITTCQVPPEQFNHDPNIRNKYGYTVAMYLAKAGVKDIPIQWQHDPSLQNRLGKTVAHQLALYNIIIPKEWEHDPSIRDNDGCTVAIYQALNSKIPDKQWEHNKFIRGLQRYTKYYNKQILTVYDILKENKIDNIPDHWKYDEQELEKYNNAIKQAQKGIIPELTDYPEYQDNFGINVALALVENNIKPPKQWFDPNRIYTYLSGNCCQYIESRTIAMALAWKKIIPDQEYYHDPTLQDDENYTVALTLAWNNLEIPEYWRHDQLIETDEGWTVSLAQSYKGKIPEKYWEHDPTIRTKIDCTVAHNLSHNKLEIPNQWKYNQEIQNSYGYTPSISQFCAKMQIDENFQNDKFLKCVLFYDNYGEIEYFTMQEYEQNCLNNFYEVSQLPEKYQYYVDNTHPYNSSEAIIMANMGEIPQVEDYNDLLYSDIKNDNVIFSLLKNNIILPKEWGQFLSKNYRYQLFSGNIDQIFRLYHLSISQMFLLFNMPLPNDFYDKHCENKPKNNEQFERVIYNQFDDIQIEDPSLQNDDGWTLAMIIAKLYHKIPDEQFNHDSKIQNKYGYTVAMYLAEAGIENIPTQWQHNPKIDNYKYETVALLYYKKGIIPPKEWRYQIQKDDYIFKELLQKYNTFGLPIIKEFTDNEITSVNDKNVEGDQLMDQFSINTNFWTKTMLYVFLYHKIPPKKYQHDPNITNDHDKTVGDYLIDQGIIPPKEWCPKPEYQDKNGDTYAMKLARKGIIPPEYLYHDCKIYNKKYERVVYILDRHKVPIANNWIEEDKDKNSKIFEQAIKGIIPEIGDHKPDEVNKYGWTVAMILAYQNIKIPPQWMHDLKMINKYNQSIFDIYLDTTNKIPDEQFWISPDYQDEYGNTQAMKLAIKNLEIPEKLYHKPYIQNNLGFTIALIQAFQGKIPDKQWIHDKFLRGRRTLTWPYEKFTIQDLLKPPIFLFDGYDEYYSYFDNYKCIVLFNTVQDFLQSKRIKVPEEWKYVEKEENIVEWIENFTTRGQVGRQTKNGLTMAMAGAINDFDIPQEFYHNPNLISCDFYYVADYIAQNGKYPPKCWQYNWNNQMDTNVHKFLQDKWNFPVPNFWLYYNEIREEKKNSELFEDILYNKTSNLVCYDPAEQFNGKFTIAMAQAKIYKMIPEEKYNHKSTLQNIYGETVGIILSSYGIIPPSNWLQDINQKDKYGNSIRSNLQKHDYIYQNGQFVSSFKYQILDDTCCICLSNGKQEFIVSKCGHKICKKCFESMEKENRKWCPICKTENWYETVTEDS